MMRVFWSFIPGLLLIIIAIYSNLASYIVKADRTQHTLKSVSRTALAIGVLLTFATPSFIGGV